MTKFEEEVKRPKKAYIDTFSKRDVDFTGVAKKFTEGAQTLKEWKEYAFVLEDKLKLKHQSLPVVPECVAEFVSGDENELSKADRIAYLLKSVQGDSYYLTEELPGDGTITVDEGQELYNWAICQHHETILELWNGYQVEKPQLFYLKHIDMSKLDETHDWFILHHGSLGHSPFCKGELPYYCNNAKFTRQEIDSMQTGSYEQIEVEK